MVLLRLVRFISYCSLFVILTIPSVASEKRDRSIASYTSEAAKHLSSAYVGFYHRHDSAGCMHLGFALSTIGTIGLGADEMRALKQNLDECRNFCLEDKTPRSAAIKAVRQSFKIVSGHEVLGTN